MRAPPLHNHVPCFLRSEDGESGIEPQKKYQKKTRSNVCVCCQVRITIYIEIEGWVGQAEGRGVGKS